MTGCSECEKRDNCNDQCDEHTKMITSITATNMNVANLIDVTNETKELVSKIYGMFNQLNIEKTEMSKDLESVNNKVIDVDSKIDEHIKEHNNKYMVAVNFRNSIYVTAIGGVIAFASAGLVGIMLT